MAEDKDRREFLFKEIDLIQKVIGRMGNNSFLIKGWGTTLIVASLLLSDTVYYHFVAFLPLIVFWYLDSYFLRIEKLYRNLYNWLIVNRMKGSEFLLDMDSKSLEKRFGKDTAKLRRVMFSKTLFAFYGLLLVIIIIFLLVDFLLSQRI